MRSFSELAAADLHWQFDTSSIIPLTGDRHYTLFSGDEPVVTAQAKWEKFVSFEVALEAGEGTYFSHMDLTASPLEAVVWKAGTSFSAAGFSLSAWSSTTFAGTITTASGRTLFWQPKIKLGLPSGEGLLLAPDGSILLSMVAKTGSTNSGKLQISAALASDPDRAALITLAFALSNEQALLLHLAPGIPSASNPQRGFFYRLHAFRPNEGVGAIGAVTTGKFGLFLLALLLGSLFLEFFSVTLWTIDTVLFMTLALFVSIRSGVRRNKAGPGSEAPRTRSN
jgi:hypothetical protein